MSVNPRAATRRDEQAAATRDLLLEVAGRLFASQGYAATSVEDISAAAGVARSALYHHFASKEALFAAVYRKVDEQFTTQVLADAHDETDPWIRLERALAAWLAASTAPRTRRILLIDGPAVLGVEQLSSETTQAGVSFIAAALQQAADVGQLPEAPVQALAHMLLGALYGSALYVVRAPEDATRQVEVNTAAALVLNALRRSH